MYGYEKTADHRSTLTEARACGQKLCDEDPSPQRGAFMTLKVISLKTLRAATAKRLSS